MIFAVSSSYQNWLSCQSSLKILIDSESFAEIWSTSSSDLVDAALLLVISDPASDAW